MAKTHDVVVVTGTYQAADGQTKKRYQNVGSLMTNDDGGQYILLDRHFNPAGIVNPEGRGSVLLSMFEKKARQDGSPQAPSHAGQPAQSVGAAEGLDMDIPF